MATTTLDTRFGLSERKRKPTLMEKITTDIQSFLHSQFCISDSRRCSRWDMTVVRSAAHCTRGRRGWHTPLCGDDCDIMPLLLLAVQLHHRADKARVGGDAEQSLGVWLGIDGVPVIQKVTCGEGQWRQPWVGDYMSEWWCNNHLMLVLCPVSGSTAWTRPTEQTGGQFSETSRWYRAWENCGGSSALRTMTRTVVWSLKGPFLM